MRNAWALFVAVGITVAVACTPGPNDDACTSTGGVCVGSDQICTSQLPYPCAGSGGTCCSPGQSSPAGTPTPEPDAGPVTPIDASSTSPDTSTSPDAAESPDTSAADTGAADTSTGDDSSTGDDAGDAASD
jgi:hypothetical protein